MSILNCYTRLTIVNCTGLPAVFEITPVKSHMRIQPLGDARVHASVETDAASFVEWVQEWFNLISYGPTYNRLRWTLASTSRSTTRFQLAGKVHISVTWGDPSVSWKMSRPGLWSMDISNAADVTMFLKCDIGQYGQTPNVGGPPSVASVELKPYLELACDEEIPFAIETPPLSTMYWRQGMDIENLVSPKTDSPKTDSPNSPKTDSPK